MIKSKFAITLHILTLLSEEDGEWLSSSYIAGSLNVNPVLVRNEIIKLKAHHLLESKEGNRGGVRLVKSPSKILLSEVFKIAKGDSNVFSLSKNMPNINCPVGKQINGKLLHLFDDIDDTISEHLKGITLEEFKNQY